MPTITGILETSLYFDDLERAAKFYQDVFGFPAMVSDRRIRALNVREGQVLLLFQRGASLAADQFPTHDGRGPLHLAFAIHETEMEAWEKRLEEVGVAIESRMRWEGGGRSIYFRDPEGHLIELATPGVWPNF
jgi:catechol 2,3-dioxygenase-like lactoylglutathione lyase family enzyme